MTKFFPGKCYPYDPNRLKGVNVEAKPGMIIQAAPTPPHQKPPPSPQSYKKNQKGHNSKYEHSGEKKEAQASKSGDDILVCCVKCIFMTYFTFSDRLETLTPTTALPTTTPLPSENTTTPATNSTATPTKKILSATRGLLERLSKLLVKFVHRIFPWNRRARRRVHGDGDDEEL